MSKLEYMQDLERQLSEARQRSFKLGAELAALKADARALVSKLNHVHDSAAYQAVWTLWQAHGGKYTGPQYREELDALESRWAERETP